MQIYLHECCHAPPLSREEEAERERHVRAADEQAEHAKKELVEANLAMVVAVAERYGNDAVRVLDLIIVGNDELMRAMKTFEGSSEGTFSELAAACVERAIGNAAMGKE